MAFLIPFYRGIGFAQEKKARENSREFRDEQGGKEVWAESTPSLQAVVNYWIGKGVHF